MHLINTMNVGIKLKKTGYFNCRKKI